MPLSIFGNVTDHAAWQPDPNGRGTSGVLQQCLIIVGFCIYSAIHLNIPVRKSTDWDKTLVKVFWLVAALLAPECIVYLAWAQRREAKAIAKDLNEATGRAEPSATRFRRLLNWLRKRPAKDKDSEDVPKDEPLTTKRQDPIAISVGNQGGIRHSSTSAPKVSQNGSFSLLQFQVYV